MNDKKLNKNLAHAEFVFEREQVTAAAAAETLSKSLAVIELHRNELSESEIKSIEDAVINRKAEIEEYLLNARNKYVAKLKELGDPRIDPETGELV